LVAVVATAGRPVGIAVGIGLALRAAELLVADRTGATRPTWRALLAATARLRWPYAAVLTSLLGLAAWCTYLWVSFGDPFAFLSVEAAPGWDQGAGPRTWAKVAFGGQLLHGSWAVKATLVPQALACLGALALVPAVWRRLGWGYAAYTLVVVGVPFLGTKDFMGDGRYVLAAFPVFAVVGAWLAEPDRPRWQRATAATVSVLGLLIATYAFGRGVEIA
jgi:hypothetical protein